MNYRKLPSKFKAKWLKALRSGDYKQTKGELVSDGRYCCLGVACKVAGFSDDYICLDSTMMSLRGNESKGLRVTNSIPRTLYEFDSHTDVKLMGMNDSEGKSFKEIAKWIEENL